MILAVVCSISHSTDLTSRSSSERELPAWARLEIVLAWILVGRRAVVPVNALQTSAQSCWTTCDIVASSIASYAV